MPTTTTIKRHGGKAYFATKFVALMPPHLHYVEPYFGGGSVLFAKSPDGVSEVVNDVDRDLTNFWRVLQCEAMFPRFQRLVEATPFSEAEYNLADARLNDPAIVQDSVRWAAAFFVACRQSLAGRLKSFTGVTRTRVRRGMNNEVSAWLSAVEGLPAVHDRLSRVLILDARPAVKVIHGHDGPRTLFYLDPPYLHDTRTSPDVYAHEMTEMDHRELLATITHERRKSKFMLSGYRSQLYDEFLGGWTRHDFDSPNHAAGGKNKARKTECLWCNFGPRQKGMLL